MKSSQYMLCIILHQEFETATVMSNRSRFNIILFLAVCLTGWTMGQTIYNAFNYYKPMTNDYDVRVRGSLFLPPCVKNLMNCWEVVGPDLFCRYGLVYRIALESMCMDLRFNCKETTGPLPFKFTNVTTWNFCAKTRIQNEQVDLKPFVPGTNSWYGTTNVLK